MSTVWAFECGNRDQGTAAWSRHDWVEAGVDKVASTKVVCDGPGDQRALHIEAATA